MVERSPVLYPSIALLHLALHKVRRGRGDCHPSIVAKERLVPADLEPISRSASASSSMVASDQEPPGSSTPRPQHSPVSCLAALGETLQAAGVSEAAALTICAGKRQSMRDLYDAKWWNFCGWYSDDKNCSPK